ncbi:MAG: PIN domain-containing protein [Acidobacteriota bacterium]
MIYLDTSVVLAHLLSETLAPPEGIWEEALVSSRLLEYEVWNRLHARRLAESHQEDARRLLGQIAFIELASTVLARVLQPFPVPVRTLDSIHLASVLYLVDQHQTVSLLTFDHRMAEAAGSLGIPLFEA